MTKRHYNKGELVRHCGRDRTQSRWTTKLHFVFAVSVVISVFSCSPSLKTQEFRVSGSAMEPNFYDGQRVKVQQVSIPDLKRGDVIVFEVDGRTYLKRLIGLPGETVAIRGDQVFINGEPLDELYDIVPSSYSFAPRTLDEDEYFVLGDNRNLSNDSRFFGPISSSHITGKVIP